MKHTARIRNKVRICVGLMVRKVLRFTVINVIALILAVFSFACAAPANIITPTSALEITPSPTPIITPSPTPAPTPEPTPVQTHQPSLSLEEERDLLGVKDRNKVSSLYGVLPYFFKFYNEKGESVDRIVWAYFGSENTDEGVYDFWSNTRLYSVPSNYSLTMSELWDQRKPYNKRFSNAEFIRVCGISELESVYKEQGISWDFPEECIQMMAKGETYIENYEAPMLDLMDLYIKFTPKEYRTSSIDFDETFVK